MISFILGEAGSGKSSFIIDKIKSQADSNKDIYVIIPEQFSFEYERKLYIDFGSKIFNRINVLSFTTLAKMIFDKFGNRTGEYADDNTKTVLMYLAMQQINKNKSLTYFVKQADNRSFITEALGIVADLRRASVTPDVFSAKLLSVDDKVREKAYDLSVIYSTYDKIMSEKGYKDSLSDITEAAASANMNDFFNNSIFFVDSFESFSPDQMEMLDIVISEADDLYISLNTADLNADEFSLFATINNTYKQVKGIAVKYNKNYQNIFMDKIYRFKNKALEQLSRSIFRKNVYVTDGSRYVKITEAKDLYQESDFVCSYIKHLVQNDGYKYSDISIASRQLSDYELILKAAMERYEIPYFIDTEKSVMHTSIVLLIIALLEMIDSKKISSEVLFRYAKTQLTEVSITDIALLENYAYKWNIDGDMWNQEFTAKGGEDPENIEYIENIRKTLLEPIFNLKEKCYDKSCADICRYIYEFLESAKVTDSLTELIKLYSQSDMTDMSSELNRLWNSIMDIFDVISSVLGDQKLSLTVFRELFGLILKQNSFLEPPQKIDIVSVVSAEKARLNNPKVTFIMGANEGILPYAVKPSGILSDVDKDAFMEAGIDLSKNTKRLLTDERFTVYKILSFASERVFLTYSLSDSMGGARYPSYILSQIQHMFTDNIRNIASGYDILFYSPTVKSAYYNYVQSYFDNSEKSVSLRQAIMKNPEYAAKINFLDSLTPDMDHKITDKSLMKKLMSDRLNISATSFQEYNLCHFKYYCHYALNIKARTQKQINMLELGNLVHMCLENILSQCRSREEFISLSDEEILKKIDRFSNEYKENNLGGDFGKNARINAQFKKLAEDTLPLINHLKDELAQSKFMPIKYELEISGKNGVKPLTIRTDDGIEIILNGKIDRVDMYEENGEKFIRIVDYKTGNQVFNLTNILFGIDMQLLLYLFTVTGKGSPFGDTVPAGILYMPSGKISLERARGDKQDKSEYLNKYYHMSGVLLKESDVLYAMEENIEGIFIPAKLTAEARKKGTFILDKTKTSCLTRVQFERLREHANRLIKSMADDLYNGDISAVPLNYDKNKDVCSYCDYWDICGNVPRSRERILPDNIDEIKAEILGTDEE